MPPKKAQDSTIVYSDDDLQARVNKVLQEKAYCDVTFLLDGGKHKVAAHKLYLIASSPVFREMFNKLDGSEVKINDPWIDVGNFKLFIQNLSTGEVEINAENVTKQLYLAHKYKAKSVKDCCSEFLSKHVKPSNVFDILPIADWYDMEELREVCIENISCGFSGKDEDVKLFSKLSLEHLIAVIDDLLSCEETDWVHDQAYRLLKASRAWLLEESNGVPSRKRKSSEEEVSLIGLESSCKRKLGEE